MNRVIVLSTIVWLASTSPAAWGQSEYRSPATGCRPPGAIVGQPSKYAVRLNNALLLRQVQQTVHDTKLDAMRHKQEQRTARLEDYKHRTATGFGWLQARGDREQLASAVRLGPPLGSPAAAEHRSSPDLTEPIAFSSAVGASILSDLGTPNWPAYFLHDQFAAERRFLVHCATKLHHRRQALTAEELVAFSETCDRLLSQLNRDAKTLGVREWLDAKRFVTELELLPATI